MAFSVELTDGTTTIDFLETVPSGSSAVFLDDNGLEIEAAERTTEYVASYLGDILSEQRLTKRRVTLRFSVVGTTEGNIFSLLSSISNLVNRSTTKIVTKVVGKQAELVVQFPGSTNDNYFRVLSGEVTVPDYVYGVAGILQKTVLDDTSYFIVRGCTLSLECLPSVAKQTSLIFSLSNTGLYAVPLTNHYGTDVTTPIAVDNTLEGSSYHNGVHFGDIGGDLPIPGILFFTEQVDSMSRIWVAHSEVSGAGFNDKYCIAIEGESTPLSSGGLLNVSTPTASSFSNGQYREFDIAAGDDDAFIKYAIPAANIEPGIYRVMVRWYVSPGSKMIISADISDNYGLLITKGEPVLAAQGAFHNDLGVFAIPQKLLDADSPMAHTITLNMHNTDTSAITDIGLDAIYLYNQSGGYRVLDIPNMYGIGGESFVDDAWLDMTYMNISSTQAAVVSPYFAPIYLQPGAVEQRLALFLMSDLGFTGRQYMSLQLKVPNLYSFFV